MKLTLLGGPLDGALIHTEDHHLSKPTNAGPHGILFAPKILTTEIYIGYAQSTQIYTFPEIKTANGIKPKKSLTLLHNVPVKHPQTENYATKFAVYVFSSNNGRTDTVAKFANRIKSNPKPPHNADTAE